MAHSSSGKAAAQKSQLELKELKLRFFDRSGFGQLNLIFKVGFQVDQGAPNRTVSGNENQGWRRVREGRM